MASPFVMLFYRLFQNVIVSLTDRDGVLTRHGRLSIVEIIKICFIILNNEEVQGMALTGPYFLKPLVKRGAAMLTPSPIPIPAQRKAW